MLRGGSIILVVLALALPASAVAATASDTSDASIAREQSLERLVLEQINVVRAAHGLGQLKASPALTRAALTHTRSMVTKGFFAHESRNGTTFWKRLKGFYAPRSSRWTVGENLAMFGGGDGPDAASIVQMWMASPPHRANLLSTHFADAGVAILYDAAAGGVYGGEPTWVVTLDVGAR